MVQIIENLDYEIDQKKYNEPKLRSGHVTTPNKNMDHLSIENVTPPLDIPPHVHVPPLVNNTASKQGEERD